MDAIILQNISKKYTLVQDRPILLKNLFLPQRKEEVWALKNISLTIKKGETIGIIGENGSGKSTLLKIISGITSPTSGTVSVNGRVASLIELGAGFHQDLTGKENVYLNGTLLGLTRKEIDRKYKEVVEFADIGKFINQPIRTYSSGMVVRLGFSVAVHLDPDILLIDEVLAVGDEEFQRKCIEAISQCKELGKTLLIVSHNLNLIARLCQKSVWINNGKIKLFEQTRTVIESYLDALESDQIRTLPYYLKKRWGTGEVRFEKVIICDKSGQKKRVFNSGEELSLYLKIKFFAYIKNPVFGFYLYDINKNVIFATNTLWQSLTFGDFDKNTTSELVINQNVNLLGGIYIFTLAIATENGENYYDYIENAISFRVKRDMLSQGIVRLNPTFSVRYKA